MQMTAQTAYGMGYPYTVGQMGMPYYGMGSQMANPGLYFNAGLNLGGSPYGNMMGPYGCYYTAGIPCAW